MCQGTLFRLKPPRSAQDRSYDVSRNQRTCGGLHAFPTTHSMEGLAAFITVSKVVELSGKIAIECWKYYGEVKSARDDIERLRSEVVAFQDAAKEVQKLLGGPQQEKLSIPASTSRSLEQCENDLASLEKALQPGKMRKFGVRALKWPLSSKGIDKVITMLKHHETSINTILNVNQIKIALKIDDGLEQAGQERYLAMIPCAKSANFNSVAHQHEPLCHQDTRIDILHEIKEWSEASDGKYVYWLNGMAGTGKSTIARTIAQQISGQGSVCGTFFFSRGAGELSKADKLANTLAVSLARKSPALLSHVCEAIKANNDVGYQGIREQWKQLIYEPLIKADKAMQERCCFVVIVDALDECDSEDDVGVFLELLSMTMDLKKAQLRVFITSRPELHIRLGFHNMPHFIYRDLVLDQVDRSVVDHDIRLFLENEMAKIGSRRKVPVGWPSEDTLDKLVARADSLFIYAATVSRYVGESPRISPEKRLSSLLAHTSSGLTAERSLDVMYLTILENSLTMEHSKEELLELSSQFRLIVGTIVLLYESMSGNALSKLLATHLAQYDEGDGAGYDLVENTVDPFASVISVPESPDSPIRVLHPSFRDFLTSKDRCTSPHFQVDSSFLHGELCSACLHVLDKYVETSDSCLEQPGLLSADLDRNQTRKSLPAHVQYAAKYWVRHSINSLRNPNAAGIAHFFEKNLLKWVQVIVHLGELGAIIEDLILLNQLRGFISIPVYVSVPIQRSTKTIDTTLEHTFSDLISFLRAHRGTIEHAPHQLYVSALLLSPHNSIVRRLHENALPAWIARPPIIENSWNEAREIFEAHNEEILDLSTSPGSRFVVSASKDKTAKVWNLQTGSLETTLVGHTGSVQSVALSTPARIIATGSKDSTARIWNVRTGACVHILEGHTGTVYKVILSSKLDIVATGAQDGDVRLWNGSTGEMVATLNGDGGAVIDMAFSEDEEYLAAGYYDGLICLWDAVSQSLVSKLRGHESAVNSVLFSLGPRGHIVASGSYDRTVKIWSVPEGDLINTLVGHSRLVKSISCSSTGTLLASASFDNTVRVWDIESGKLIKTLKEHNDALICVAFATKSETLLASAGKDRTVRIWDVTKRDPLFAYKGHSRTVNAITWTTPKAGDEYLASASRDHTIRVWDPSTVKPFDTGIDSHSDDVSGIEMSPDGLLLATRSKDKSVRLWKATSGKMLHAFNLHTDWVSALVFSPNSQMLASGGHDHTVSVYHIDGRYSAWISAAHSRSIVNLTFSPDNEKLASYAYDQSVKIWTVQGTLLCEYSHHTRLITTVQFSADSWRLASGSYDSTITVYDLEKNVLQQKLRGHIRAVNAVHFSPDGYTIASGAKDRTVKIWDVSTGQLKMTLRGYSDSVTFVLFSAKADRLITRAASQVLVWNVQSGDLLSKLDDLEPFLLDAGASGVWSPQKSILVKQVAMGQLEEQIHYRYSRKWLRLPHTQDTDQLPSITLEEGSCHDYDSTELEKMENITNVLGFNRTLQWITHADKNVLFLPGHLRPRVFALAGETVITGNGTGRVMVFGFRANVFGKPQRPATGRESLLSTTSSLTLS